MVKKSLNFFGLQKHDSEFKNAKNLTKQVSEKYGNKPDVFGHSRGGAKASYVAKHSNQVYTYNKPSPIQDNLFKQDRKNIHNYRATFDPVSALNVFKSKNLGGSLMPLKAHSTKIKFF